MGLDVPRESALRLLEREEAIAAAPPRATQRWALAGAFLLSAYYFVTSVYISLHRMFWYDEVLTTRTIRLADWRTIWNALLEGGTPNPIGYFAVARTFDQWFGPAEIGMRLPSTLAVIGGMWLTYAATRHVTDRLHGLIAMAVLTCSFLPYYAYEGRSYGLHFFLAALALWTWTTKRSPYFLAAAFFCGVLVHYYIVLCMLPLLAEEAFQWRPWQRPSRHILAAAIGATAGMAAMLPLVITAQKHWSGDFWATPLGRLVPSLYTSVFPTGLFLLSMTVLWVILNHDPKNVPVHPVSSAERTGWFALGIPVAAYFLGRFITHALVDRYLIGMIPGVALGFACMLYRCFPATPRISGAILVLFASCGIVTQYRPFRHPDQIEAYGPAQQRTRAILAIEEQLWASGARYIVLDIDDLLYQTARYYSKHPGRYVSWTHPGPPPNTFVHYPMQYWNLDDVKLHAREAVFVDINPERLESLQRAGFRTSVHNLRSLAVTRAE